MNTDDINEALGYDADIQDPRQHCRHGTFIGSWWGPDYLCGWCESGEEPPTPEEQLQIKVVNWRARLTKEAKFFDDVVELIATVPDIAQDRRYRLIHLMVWDLMHINLEPWRQVHLAYDGLVAAGVDPWGDA